MIVEALAEPDGIVEAIRWRGPSYVLGVQWHPEFMFGPGIGEEHLDGSPILNEFLDAVRTRKSKR
jgi:putative glutamine amidotransferase